MKKGIKILIWVFSILLLLAIIVFVSVKRSEAVCTKITVKIADTANLNLINEQEIRELIEPRGTHVKNKRVKEINIDRIERRIKNYPSVKHGEIYIDINGELIARIVPRVPLVRISNRINQHYYIDSEGYLMPVSQKHPSRLVVANGNISHKPKFDTIFNIYNRKLDKRGDIKTLRDIHELASFIKSKPFWNAQVQQIFINNEDEFELATLVGDQIIYLGSIENYEEKLRNLEIFYKKGMPSKGWGIYSAINLKFKNQVVCTRRN